MNKYEIGFKVNMVLGSVDYAAHSEEEAIEKALNYVCKQLDDALPELDFEVEANVEDVFYGGDPDEKYAKIEF